VTVEIGEADAILDQGGSPREAARRRALSHNVQRRSPVLANAGARS
jgi:hypothetical protein